MSNLYLFMGFPCTGKTTVAKSMMLPIIEVDEVRKSLTGTYEPTEEGASLVADVIYQSVQHYLSRGMDVAVEGLFSTASSRQLFVDLAKQCEADVQVHWFDPGISWIQSQLMRHPYRKEHVNRSYIDSLSASFEFPTADEGFDRLVYYNELDLIEV